jgi:dipeptidyl aminopeptidase/acylaminoacyl peptidase
MSIREIAGWRAQAAFERGLSARRGRRLPIAAARHRPEPARGERPAHRCRAKASCWIAAAQIFLACAISSAPAAEGPPHKPVFGPLDVFDLQWVTDPEISPDGQTIAYIRTAMDIKTDRVHGSIWLVGSDGKHERPLSGAAGSSMPRWSPDGTRIAYLASAGDGSGQIFVYWAQSGVTAAISHFTESPTSIAWSPDGRWLAFTMPAPAEHKTLKVELPQAPKGAGWAEPPKLIDRMVYRVDGEGYLPNSYGQLFVVPSDGGPARQLTHGDFDHDGPAVFTPDGKSLLISANRRADAEYEPLDSEIYKVDLADGAIHALTDRRGPDANPAVSPDGRHIAYLGFDDKRVGYQTTQLYVMDADGGNSRPLTAALDRDAANPRWSGDGRQIFFSYTDRGTLKLATVDLAGKMRVLAGDLGGADVTRPYVGGSFSVAANGRFAYMRASPNAPPALATGTSAKDIATIASLADNLLEQRSLTTVEEISFPSSADGRGIQGWIRKPPGFDPAVRYPLLLEIHGGPFEAYGPSFAAEHELFAAAGYVVLYVNPRGSTSYGEEFGNLINHDYPDKDFDDLMSGVDAVIQRGYVDRNRLFVTGGSGGGVLTAWIVGHTDRFRAAVVVKPVINWTSFVLTADFTGVFYRYWFEGFPWDHEASYWKRSPLAYAGNVHTPTMLMTGEVDYRAPSGEAEQFYEALKLRRVDTALVRVPNASHDISARPSLLNAKVAYVLAWFRAHDSGAPP